MNATVNINEISIDSVNAYLVGLDGARPLLIDGIVTVGREASCDLAINDPHVSAQHCRIEKRPGGFFIRDLKSTNGISVNGVPVSEGRLFNGSQVQIGKTNFVFQTEKPIDNLDDFPIKSKNSDWNARLQSIKHLAKTDLPVFLQGESGTGKEVIAHLIHDFSDRAEGPFISVNCSALTESLVESELFGHLRGSYTGATNDRKGAFEAEKGGTLFLDEIGDLPLSLQPKLLRALENKEIKPVGSDKVISTDVRIITATHKSLDLLVAEKAFRSDLYFRIHVVKFLIPALRDRMEDFENLLYHYCREYRVRFSVAAIEKMKDHTWPGNIRELKNSIARSKALFHDTYIQPDHLTALIDKPMTPPNEGLMIQQGIGREGGGSILKEVEKEIIKAKLVMNQGNQRKTALDLGMPKSTLHDRIKNYNIEIKSLLNL